MQRSKSIALSFLLGALLVGGALGFTADRLVHPARSTRQEMRKQIAHDLSLTSDQATAVDSILDRRNRDFDAAMTPIKPRLDSIRDKARQDIRQLLSPAQRQAFDSLLVKQHSKNTKETR